MLNSDENRPPRRSEEDEGAASVAAAPHVGETLIGIQVLRGLAALLVVFHHYVGTSVERGFAIPGLENAAIGNAGVDIFFVISGFIMEYTAGARTYQSGDRSSFLMRRLARILPLYWALTLTAYGIATFLPFVVNSTTSTKQLIYSLALLPDGAVGSYVLPLAWTLTFEMVFYLLFAVTLSLKPWQRVAALAVVFAPSLILPESLTAQNPLLGVALNPILYEFLAGVMLAQMVRSGESIPRFASAALVAAGGLMLLLELNNNVTDSLLRLLLWGVPALLVVGGVVLAHRPRTTDRPDPLVRMGAWIGDRSYSLYLSHFFAISMFSKVYFHYLINVSLPPWLSGLGLFLSCLLVAHLCYLLIERPARLGLNQVFSRRRLQPKTA